MVEEGGAGGWRLSLVKLISDSSRYRSAQFRDSSTEMGGAKWMGILVKMLGGVGGLRWRGFGRLDEHRMYRTEVEIRIIFRTRCHKVEPIVCFSIHINFLCITTLQSQKDGPHIVE